VQREGVLKNIVTVYIAALCIEINKSGATGYIRAKGIGYI